MWSTSPRPNSFTKEGEHTPRRANPSTARSSQLSGLLQIDPGAALRTMTPSKAVEEAPAREIDRLNAPRTVG